MYRVPIRKRDTRQDRLGEERDRAHEETKSSEPSGLEGGVECTRKGSEAGDSYCGRKQDRGNKRQHNACQLHQTERGEEGSFEQAQASQPRGKIASVPPKTMPCTECAACP